MAVYCKKHAANGMVNVSDKRCLYVSCTTVPCFIVEGSKTAVYCKDHAEHGMVNVHVQRCLYDSCKRRPSFNIKYGKRAM